MNRVDAYRMIQRRGAELGTRARIGWETMGQTRIAADFVCVDFVDVKRRIRHHEIRFPDQFVRGFSQQQSGDQSLTFTSQHGLVRVADLPLVIAENHDLHDPSVAGSLEPTRPQKPAASAAAPAPASTEDILTTVERLSDLRQKNILTETEFAAKKAELLSRL